jgi:ABC-2 type transport system permease protein
MNLNLWAQALKERWLSALIFSASLFLYSLTIVAVTEPFIGEPALRQLLERYPEEVLALAAGGLSGVDMFTPEGFLTIEYFALWLIVIVGGFAIAFTTSIVSKEIDDGTISILLTQPLRRNSLILSRFLALTLYLLILLTVAFGSTGLLAPVYGVKLKVSGLLAAGVLAFAFVLVISAYTLLFSVIFKGRGRAIIFSVALFLASHLLNALAELSKTLEKVRFLSFFYYYKPYEALRTGNLPWSDLGLFLTIIIICLLLSLVIFARKDIATA